MKGGVMDGKVYSFSIDTVGRKAGGPSMVCLLRSNTSMICVLAPCQITGIWLART